MAQDYLLLRQFVSSLVRRERALLGLHIGARTAALLLAGLLWAAIAAVSGVDRAAAALLLASGLGIGAWFTVGLPLWSLWRAAADPLRQARHVERLVPDLGGRLVTAMAHPDGARGGESEALLGLIVRRARAATASLTVEDVYPSRPALRSASLAGAAWLVGLVVVAVLGPAEVSAFWFRGGDAHAEGMSAPVKTSEDVARVGDVVLKYHYPDYTGLPEKTIPNSTGDVLGPPGTTVEITARSGDPVEAAGLVAYEDALEARVDADGRTLSGTFAIGAEPGAWRLLLYRGGEPERSRAFTITPEKDLAPDVVLEEQDTLEVALDEAIELHWQVRDDFGVKHVLLALDGKDTERVLEQPEQRRAELSGASLVSPRELGLSPGDRVRLSIAAWDNDTVSGSKRGESRAVELVVLGATGLDRRAAERRQELVDVMLPILAALLTDPSPEGDTGGAVARWGEVVGARYRPLTEAAERLWKGTEARGQERALVEKVLDSARKLVRYTQVSFEPSSSEPARPEALAMVGALREDSVVALENAILALAKMLESDALADLLAQAKDLDASGEALKQAARDPESTAQELLSRLDQTQRMLAQLAKLSEKLQESGLREFVNLRQSETSRLMEEVRKALAEGRMDEARQLMERLGDQVRDLSRGIEEEMRRRAQQGSDAQKKAEELKAKLRELERRQRDLQKEVQAVRDADQGSSEELEQLWKQIEERVERHRASADEHVAGLEANERPFFEVERAKAGLEEAGRLAGAVRVRDLVGARLSLEEARISWGAVEAAIRMMIRQGMPLKGPGAREVDALQQQLESISALLDRLEQQAGQVDPETLQRSHALEDRQRALQGELQQAAEEAEQLAREFPVRPEGMEEALKDADGRMGQAGDDLQQGQPMQAEGSQGVAAQRVHDAIQSIEQAQRQAAEQARPSSGSEQSPQGGERNGTSSMQDRMDLEIPRRDEYVPPAEYRRLLLEGMEGEVPEEYRALKQRYFEELVRQ